MFDEPDFTPEILADQFFAMPQDEQRQFLMQLLQKLQQITALFPELNKATKKK